MSKILAIDPGSEQSAFVLWDGQKILMAQIEDNDTISDWLEHCYRVEDCRDVVIEMIASYGMPVGREVFETCVWVGRFVEAADRLGYVHVERFPRSAVKVHHCHSNRAKDSNVAQALRDKYGGKGTKASPGLTYGLKKDLWQAFALATMVTEKAKSALERHPAEELCGLCNRPMSVCEEKGCPCR